MRRPIKRSERERKLLGLVLLIQSGIQRKKIPDGSLIVSKNDTSEVVALSKYIDKILKAVGHV